MRSFRAPHPAPCTSTLCGCVCMALTTASMPPALAILVWFSAWEAAKMHRAPHPYCCESLFDECRVIIWMMTDGLPSWTSLCIAVLKRFNMFSEDTQGRFCRVLSRHVVLKVRQLHLLAASGDRARDAALPFTSIQVLSQLRSLSGPQTSNVASCLLIRSVLTPHPEFFYEICQRTVELKPLVRDGCSAAWAFFLMLQLPP